MNVVVRTADGALSLLVDEIGDVLEVHEETFERPPETLQGISRELVLGVATSCRTGLMPDSRYRKKPSIVAEMDAPHAGAEA